MFGESKLNLVLVVGAVLVILIGWQFLMPVFFPTPERPPQRDVEVTESTVGQESGVKQWPSDDKSAVEPMLDRRAAISASDRIMIDGDRVRGSILLKGARFDDVVLKDYRAQMEENSPNVFVFSPRNSEHPYFAEFGWTQDGDADVTLPNSNTVWQANRSNLKSGSSVTLSWDNGDGLLFTRKIFLDERGKKFFE